MLSEISLRITSYRQSSPELYSSFLFKQNEHMFKSIIFYLQESVYICSLRRFYKDTKTMIFLQSGVPLYISYAIIYT